MVVRFHFDQELGWAWLPAIQTIGAGQEARIGIAPHHGGVVVVGRDDVRHRLAGAPDAGEQRLAGFAFAIHAPPRVEDLVPTVLRVGLREHHQLGIGGIAPQFAEHLRQVVHFRNRQGEAHALVRHRQHLVWRIAKRDAAERPAGALGSKRGEVFVEDHGLRHAVVQQLRAPPGRTVEVPAHAPFHPSHRRQAAAMEDVRGLAGPRGNGAWARHGDAVRRTDLLRQAAPRAVAQQLHGDAPLPGVEFAVEEQEVDELREEAAHAGFLAFDALSMAGQTSARERRRPAEDFKTRRHRNGHYAAPVAWTLVAAFARRMRCRLFNAVPRRTLAATPRTRRPARRRPLPPGG